MSLSIDQKTQLILDYNKQFNALLRKDAEGENLLGSKIKDGQLIVDRNVLKLLRRSIESTTR
jgi:hypothetical protein